MVYNFEPQILAFLCNWCSYAAADMAGISRVQYPPNVRVVRVMCSARVDPVFVVRGFLYGFDGVLVLGCHLGDCHYQIGNYHAEIKMRRLKNLLEIAGVARERLCIDWASAAEGTKFGQIITTFTERIRQEGSLDKDALLLQKLHAAELTTQNAKVRWLLGNELNLIEHGNIYGEKIATEKLDKAMDEVIKDEFTKCWLMLVLEASPMSVREMASMTGLSGAMVSSYITELEEVGQVRFHVFEGRAAKYVKGEIEG